MNKKIILRRHVITLLPDAFLFFVSFLFLLALQAAHTQGLPGVEEVCVIAVFVFSLVGILDILKWGGFSVALTPTCVEIRQFWLLRKEYCRGARGKKISIRPVQNTWEEWLNKGTLVVYEPGAELVTLDNLGNFRSVFEIYGMMQH